MPLLNSNVSNSAIPILETLLSDLSSYWLVKVIFLLLKYLISTYYVFVILFSIWLNNEIDKTYAVLGSNITQIAVTKLLLQLNYSNDIKFYLNSLNCNK